MQEQDVTYKLFKNKFGKCEKNDIILDDVPKTEFKVKNVHLLAKKYVKKHGKIQL